MTRDSEWNNPVRDPAQSAISNLQSAIGPHPFRLPRSAFGVVGWALLVFGALPTALGAEEAALVAPDPATLQTFDHPSDDGFAINIEWGRSKSEAANVYYVVEVASEQDYRAGRFHRVARIPSLTKLKSDEKRLHSYEDEAKNRANRALHYLAVEPASVYPVEPAKVRESDYYLRVALVATRKAIEKRKKPPEPPPAPSKKQPRKPILLAAKEQTAEWLARLQALQATLAKEAATMAGGKGPTLADTPLLPSVAAIEGGIEGAMVLREECLAKLRELDGALKAGPERLKREAEEWAKLQAEARRQADVKAQNEKPKKEYEDVEIETESEPVYVTEAGAPKAVKARPSLPPLLVPEAASFRAYDLPSDDGARIAVVWRRTASENERTTYVIEMAEMDEDGKPGPFKQAAAVPSLGAEMAAQAKYFGFSPANKRFHALGISPAEVFKPSKEAVRRAVVEREMKRMPTAWAPETELPQHVQALIPVLTRYIEEVKRVDAAIEELAGPLAAGIEKADQEFLPRLARYRAYAARLKRFETHVASRAATALADARQAANRKSYAFRLLVRRGRDSLYDRQDGTPREVVAAARPDYFRRFKLNNLLFSIGFCGVVYAFIRLARRNPNLFIRKIAGLEAVEEAIGRATEMGRRVYFVHGLGGMGDLSTIAAVSILSRVVRRSAQHDTRMRVMNIDPIVLAVSQEVAKQAYTEAGRPDAYNPDDVSLVASDQFSYAAAVGGLMVRERPATIFLMGSFAAESLLLAETGASTGAIQIAGTDSYTQIPFFITACDYTLIGEELYAASAYLSREPRMLGSLRGQDVGKAFLMVIILAGSLTLTLGKLLGYDWSIIQKLFEAF